MDFSYIFVTENKSCFTDMIGRRYTKPECREKGTNLYKEYMKYGPLHIDSKSPAFKLGTFSELVNITPITFGVVKKVEEK